MSKPYYSDESVTLYHGDCREVTAWLEADVLVTDPPYGISYIGGGSRKGYRNRASSQPIANDGDTSTRDAALAAWGARPALVFGSWRVERPTQTRQVLIWWKREGKNLARHGGRPWVSNWEEIYVLGDFAKRAGEDAAHGVIPTDEHRSAAYGEVARWGHPTPKPVSLMQQLIQRCPEGAVADPFAGVGATLLAAKVLGRNAIGVELEERYCEVIAKRLAQGVLDFGEVTA